MLLVGEKKNHELFYFPDLLFSAIFLQWAWTTFLIRKKKKSEMKLYLLYMLTSPSVKH